jgi:hypothetical protein
MKVKKRGIGIVQLLLIRLTDLNPSMDKDTQVMMKDDIRIEVEKDDRNMRGRIHQLGDIGNRNIELKHIQKESMTMIATTNHDMITITDKKRERDRKSTTDHVLIPTSLLLWGEPTHQTRVYKSHTTINRCPIWQPYPSRQKTDQDQELDQCNILLPPALSPATEVGEGDIHL